LGAYRIGAGAGKCLGLRRILPTFPLKHDLQIKKRLHFHFGCHFGKLNAHTAKLRRFAHFLPKSSHFARILGDFARIFTNSQGFLIRTSACHRTG